MTTLIYDIECYKDLFHITYLNPERNNKPLFYDLTWHITMTKDEIARNHKTLMRILNKPDVVHVGYNNLKYDSRMITMAAICLDNPKYLQQALQTLKDFSDLLINNKQWYRVYKNIPNLAIYDTNKVVKRTEIDLMRLHRLFKSLKSIGINLHVDNIQELPFDPSHQFGINKKEIQQLIDYCHNDVLVTWALYKYSEREIRTRKAFAKHHPKENNSEYWTMSRSMLAMHVIHQWIKEGGMNEVTLNKLIDIQHSRPIQGKNLLMYRGLTQTEAGKEIEQKYSDFIFDIYKEDTRLKFKEVINLKGVEYTFAEGGLHTKDSAMFAQTTKDHMVVYADVSSYYPNLIINHELVNPQIRYCIIPKLKEEVEIRLKAKAAGDKDTSEVRKIVINAISGLLGDSRSILYHKPSHLAMLINGQLLLFALAEALTLNGARILMCNTDGIVYVCSREGYKKTLEILQRWQDASQLSLDTDVCKVFAATATNNYMYIGEKEQKGVGLFNTKPYISQSGSMNIVSLALYNYFATNTHVEDFLRQHDNIHDFLINQNTDKKFDVFLTEKDAVTKLEQAQNVNRWYWSTKSNYQLSKFQNNQPKGKIARSENCKLANYVNGSIPKDIDYDRYFLEVDSFLLPILKNEVK